MGNIHEGDNEEAAQHDAGQSILQAREEGSPVTRARPRWKRAGPILVIAVAVGLFLGAAAGGITLWLWTQSIQQEVGRVDAFRAVPEQSRPAKEADKGKNFLVVGSDAPHGSATAGTRTDIIIMVHVSAGRQNAYTISIPRDTWVSVPAAAREGAAGKAKINSAFALGGTPLLIQTVENFTRVRIDHVLLVDFSGFENVIDELGGITVSVEEDFVGRYEYTKGNMHMDGKTALDYARQRMPFRDGDFTRMRHQQQVFSAVAERATDIGLLANPRRLDAFLKASANAITVDQDLSLFDILWSLRDLRATDIVAITSPTSGTGTVGDESVVFPDEKASEKLFDTVRTDTVADWVKKHRPK